MAPTSKRVLSVILFSVLLVGCTSDEETASTSSNVNRTDVSYATPESDCDCDPGWFPHSQTPPPAEGEGSPFDVSSTTNCIFHQWSWQKFLWLTKPQENNLPLFLNETIQVSDLMRPVKRPSGISVVLTDTEQAGSNGVLESNPGYNGSKSGVTVYYSIHVNETMQTASEAFRAGLADGTIPVNNLDVFPVGSFELKVSWINVSAIPPANVGNYFTTEATVDGGKTTVALMGMHIVGIVQNHPEFIWATFEHNDMAPNYDWKNSGIDSDTQRLIYAKGKTTGLDGITWSGSAPKLPFEAYDLFQYGVPRITGNGFMATSQEEPKNFDNVQHINACVAENLKDVWNNYFYNGSIWINTDNSTPAEQAKMIVTLGGSIDSAKPGAPARGSLNCANVTMETYTQTFVSSVDQINVANLVNCFTCHNGVNFNTGDKSPLYISHIFDASLKHSAGKTRAQINVMKDLDHQNTFRRKRR